MTALTPPSTDQVQASIKVRDALRDHINANSTLDDGEAFDLSENLLILGFIDIPNMVLGLDVEV